MGIHDDQLDENGWQPRSILAGVGVFLALLVGGGVLGSLLSQFVLDGEKFVNVVSIAFLPCAVLIGTGLWQLVLKVVVVAHIAKTSREAYKRGGMDAALSEKPRAMKSAPALFIFPLVYTLLGVIAGFLISLQETKISGFIAVVLYAAVGMAYGIFHRRLVKKGYIVIFEEESDLHTNDSDVR